MSKTGFVYAIGIEATTYVKIGHAKSPERRLAAMQTSVPFKLELIYSLEVEHPGDVERALHEMLDGSHVRGEWFEMPETLLAELFALAVKHAPPMKARPVSPIGLRVLTARGIRGISQAELALRAECSVKSLNYIETGRTEGPDARIIAGIADALGVSCDYLLGLSDELAVKEGARKE
jgi:DNA-binding XRE family transcriptional regulator